MNTRKIIASILAMIMLLGLLPPGVLAAEGGARYSDTEGHWGAEAIETWSSHGVIAGGGDETFRPDDTITRGEMAKIIATALHLSEIGENIFADLDETAWYAESVLKCYAAGIMVGDGAGHVFPTAPITRQEASKMLAIALGLAPVETQGNTAFTDSNRIDDWAAPYVEALRKAGYINGVGDGRFEPTWLITRASVVTILDNAVAAYITEPGTYSGAYDGIVIIACDGVVLENSTVNGNIIVTGEAGSEKDVVIQNSSIAGDLIVLGNDESAGSVKLIDTKVAGEVIAGEGVVKESTTQPGPTQSVSDWTPTPEPEIDAPGNVTLARAGASAAPIVLDERYNQYDGLYLIAEAVAGDIELVTGSRPAVRTSDQALPARGVVILAGELDDPMIQALDMDWDIASTDWERYQTKVVKDDSLTKVIVAGSDKRGTMYGLFRISQDLGGVSPWVYWGDVAPVAKNALTFTVEALECISETPSVQYRGIFFNDEAPSLTGFVKNQFGEYNYLFYANAFELIIRLKGNYLWPAMWSNQFNEDGILGFNNAKDTRNLDKLAQEDRTTLANAILADRYGVVMGASHHEPMARAGVEWGRLQGPNPPKYDKPVTSGTDNAAGRKAWAYSTNKDNIYDFWNDGIVRNKPFENMLSLGMRGEGDSALADATVPIMRQIFADQKRILENNDYSDVGQVWFMYKETEDLWYGNPTDGGLKDFDLLEDVIVAYCEDNNGTVRTLPGADERDRKWGMYYHFDYHGGPTSYEWVNTVPLARVWENMTKAYDHGVDDLWVVNVGDLKPVELPISYFLDLAYDFETYGTANPNTTEAYTQEWVKQQFGSVLNETEIGEVEDILTGYADINGNRKPEAIQRDNSNTHFTYKLHSYNEAQQQLAWVLAVEALADKYLEKFEGTDYEDAYYQLVYYPAAATANVNAIWIYAYLNKFYADAGSTLANVYAELTEDAIQRDKDLQDYYNNTMSDGYWKHMMSSHHVGYNNWNGVDGSGRPVNNYPVFTYITPQLDAELLVEVQDSAALVSTGAATLPDFENTEMQEYAVVLTNKGRAELDYSISADKNWIVLTESGAGALQVAKTIGVSVDWSKLTASDAGTVTVTSGDQTVTIAVNAKVIDTSALPEKTFTMSNGIISIGAEHYAAKGASADGTAEWAVLENYGKHGSTVKPFPSTSWFEPTGDGPYLEYKVNIPEDGEYKLRVHVGMINKAYKGQLTARYGISIDGGAITVGAIALHQNYGEDGDMIFQNGKCADTTHSGLTAGVHTIRIYAIDAALPLQKLMLYKASTTIARSYYQGPKQATYHVGQELTQQTMVRHQVPDLRLPPEILTQALPDGTQNAPYIETLTALGTKPITWALAAGSTLPAGLILNAATGEVSGAPTTGGVFTFTVTATNNEGTDDQLVSLEVIAANATPIILTNSLPDGTFNVSYHQTLVAKGARPIRWSVTNGSLPNGLSLNTDTGVLSGTPTMDGNFTFTVTATNMNGSISKEYTVQIINLRNWALAVNNGTVVSAKGNNDNDGEGGSANNHVMNDGDRTGRNGQTGVGRWRTNSLPATVVMGLDAPVAVSEVIVVTQQNDGTFYHEPAASDTTSLGLTTITVSYWNESEWVEVKTSASSNFVIRTIALDTPVETDQIRVVLNSSNGWTRIVEIEVWGVRDATAPVITTADLPDGTKDVAYSAAMESTGSGPIVWSVDSGSLPTGLTLNAQTGAISGTPTEGGTFAFTVKATNSVGSNSKAYTVTIAGQIDPPVITTDTLPSGKVGTAYSQTLSATGTAPITWSVDSGSLPTGLSLNTDTGTISGTPTADGTFTFTVKATNPGSTNTKQYTVTIAEATYNVTFNPKGGTAVLTQTGVTQATQPGSPPTKAPFVFSHWSLSDGGGAYDFGNTLTKDITLYAVWKAPTWWAEHQLFPATDPALAPLCFAGETNYNNMIGGEGVGVTDPRQAYQTGDPAGLDATGPHATSLKLIAASNCRGLSIRFRDSSGNNLMVDATATPFTANSVGGDKYVYVVMDLYNPSASNLGIRLFSYTGSSNNGVGKQFGASNGVFTTSANVVNLVPGWNRLEGYVLLPGDNASNLENHIQIRPHTGGADFTSDFYITNVQIWYANTNGGLDAQP